MKSNRLQTLWLLFVSFFRVGLFTFGGGLAMLPILEREVIERRKWAEQDEILNIYALAQSVPGVIAANTAIFLGNRLAGVLGAISALVGIVSPSLVIIITIAIFFERIQEYVLIARAFEGIRGAVVGLIAAAAVKIGLGAVRDYPGLLIATTVLLLSLFTNLSAILIIVAGGVCGILIYMNRPANKAAGSR